MIKFEQITMKNIREVCRLELEEEQKSFVASNVESLAEAFAARNEGQPAEPFAIYDDEILIGFVMLGYGSCGDEDEPDIAEGNYVLWRLMIDKKHQHKGYAKQILDEVIGYVKTSPCGPAEYIWLSYEPENEHGRNIYQKYGFRENGECCGTEIVAALRTFNVYH